jgi:putative DNA primase/helicase
MRQDFFEFQPQFKLVVIGNHKPTLRNVDDAAKRRFNMVLFTHKPPNPDQELHKLRAEWPGILRWMIDGCLAWQRGGLVRPKVVVDATAEYFSGWRTVARQAGRNLSETVGNLFKSWTQYALASGEQPGSKKRFGDEMRRLGFEPVDRAPGTQARGYLRIALKQVDAAQDPYWQN